MKRTAMLALAIPVLCGACDARDTGSFEEQAGENLIAWSRANPIVSDATWANVRTLTCEPKAAKSCGPTDCKKFEPSTFVQWHPQSKEYERCSGKAPCDRYTAQVSYTGSFANIAVPESGFLARLTANGDFMEILTQMDSVIVYHGHCQPT